MQFVEQAVCCVHTTCRDPFLCVGYLARVPCERAENLSHVLAVKLTRAHICTQAAWLDLSPTHVVGIHCKGGKGRTGLFTSSLLIWTFFLDTDSDGDSLPPLGPSQVFDSIHVHAASASCQALAHLLRSAVDKKPHADDSFDLGRVAGALSYFAKRRTKSSRSPQSDMQGVTAPCQQR